MDWLIDAFNWLVDTDHPARWQMFATVALAVGGSAFGAFKQYQKAKEEREAFEEAADELDWYDVGMQKAKWPDYMKPKGYTAKVMALYACAAYPDEDDLHRAMKEKLGEEGIKFHVWSYAHAEGIIAYNPADNEAVIAFAGTNDSDSVKDDLMTFSTSLGDWEATDGVPVSDDAKNVRGTLGFINYANACWEGVTRCAEKNKIPIFSLSRTFLAGHSLANTTANYFSMLKPFENAEVYGFAGARPWRTASQVPERSVMLVRDLLDIVPSMPPIVCKHTPKRDNIITIGRRGKKPKIPIVYMPLAIALKVGRFARALVSMALAKLGFPLKLTLATAHSSRGLLLTISPYVETGDMEIE